VYRPPLLFTLYEDDLRYEDIIPDIKLNIINRNEELTKPLLRLFRYRNDSPNALKEVRLGLSKFILGKNESRMTSIEAKLLETVIILIGVRNGLKNANNGQDDERFEGLPEYAL
jgi:hypothetical protein